MKDSHSWGMANYKGRLHGAFTYNGKRYDFDIKTTPKKFMLEGYNWAYPLKSDTKGIKFDICGMYQDYDKERGCYLHEATLKYQIISTKVCWVKVYEKDKIKGHGYTLVDEIEL